MAIYLDARPEPIFPRWVAPFNIAIAVAIAPAAFAAVFQTGPLAWNGFISFWLRIVSYGLYIVVMFFVLRGAIKRQEEQEDAVELGSLNDASLAEPVTP
jgi:membrane protein implicated in regulation of membrane protease activity